jgi:hypothetical protein
VIALGVALSSPILVWTLTRPRTVSWRGIAGLFVESFVVVLAAVTLTRYAAIPALQWLSARLP